MIAIDATPLQSEHRFRGVGTYTRQLVEHLAAKIPDQVTFIATKNGMDLLPDAVRQHALTGWRGHRPAQVYWLYNEVFLRQMLRSIKPTLFHATDFNGTVRLPRIPTVATLHDLTNIRTAAATSGLSTRLSDWRWQVYYQRKLPHVDHLIAVSQFVKNDAVSLLNLDPDRISVVPHGIDPSIFYPARGQGKFAHRPPYILFVGSRDPNKNLEGVLQAFALVAEQTPEIRLAIAGRWNSDDIRWLKQRVAQDSRLASRVEHLGFVANEDMASLYSNAEVFLFLSLAEGFGFPVIEAMACGTPVVASNRGAIPEIAGDAALLVDPSEHPSMAKAIMTVLAASEVKTEYGNLGVTRAKLYQWETVADQTLAIYETIRAHN